MHPSEDIRGSKSRALAGRKVVLAVSGSIAAVETVKLARELIRHGADVYPVMTPEAERIVHPNSLWFATGRKPVTEITGAVEHVELCGDRTGRADVLLVAPATANTISKMACGIDDTPVTTFATTALGTGMKVIVAPAMHASMYRHPAVRENIEKLESMGVRFCWPREEEGKAKLADIDRIVCDTANFVNGNGRSMLVLYGATEEPLDDMRVLTNRSSGLTGHSIAVAAYMAGYDVDVWRGRNAPGVPWGKEKVFTTVDSMVSLASSSGGKYDVIVNAAAISDYRPVRQDGKIPSGRDGLSVALERNPKVMPMLKPLCGGVMVGFKAESTDEREKLVSKARTIIESYGLDMVVANSLAVAGGTETRVVLVKRDGEEEFSGSKESFGPWLVDRITSALE